MPIAAESSPLSGPDNHPWTHITQIEKKQNPNYLPPVRRRIMLASAAFCRIVPHSAALCRTQPCCAAIILLRRTQPYCAAISRAAPQSAVLCRAQPG